MLSDSGTVTSVASLTGLESLVDFGQLVTVAVLTGTGTVVLIEPSERKFSAEFIGGEELGEADLGASVHRLSSGGLGFANLGRSSIGVRND